MRPRFIVVVLALVLVAAACGDDDSTATTSLDESTPSTATAVGQSGFESELEQLVIATEQVRGLSFIEDPIITIVSHDELAERVADQIEEDLDPEELEVSQALFELLGLLDGSIDLGDAYTALYSEQVGGYYDDETGELVIAAADELSPLSRTIVVHELIHSLTDQHFGFAAVMDDLIDAERFHEASALQALVEGDATFHQILFLQSLPEEQQVDAVTESLSTDTAVLDSLPAWFGEDLTFPYDAGFAFVDRIASDRGTAGINQAYELLPTTTEQILHPEAYFSLEPGLPVELPVVTPDGYEVFEAGSFGEWNIRLLLLDGVQPGEAVVGADGWAGDSYTILWAEGEVAFVLAVQSETPRDAQELAEGLASSVAATMAVGSRRPSETGTTFGAGADFAEIRFDGTDVWFVAASDPTVGRQLADAVVPTDDG